ncbi:proteasome activator complex subunit 4 [Plakobranchus ocellatus]|uniref:Proteasome activator complex subunit 4 n=1 Tax=Plakobranchus ocellatus TaxID=259542 RepID=A0AAV3ZKS5_9GAST|nr:proteasome activator complex subunit 4 [Plakobranchus ocellatus]
MLPPLAVKLSMRLPQDFLGGVVSISGPGQYRAISPLQIEAKIIDGEGGSENVVQEHINKLFKALHSFFHPSNVGRWTLRLGSFLQNLPKSLVKRLRREHYKECKWLTAIPHPYKLTDAQVTEFVESVKPSVFVAIFSKMGSQDSSMGLRHLATLRPEIVIPPFLEKMYPAMETLIEPHRLIACMVCMVHIARPMLTATKHFPEGRSHVLPLLNLALPGIDPNDFRKTLVTLQMISTFVTLIPIVDSSEAIHVLQDLNEHERELCSATAQFEDFVLAFLDRIFNLIESNSQEASIAVVERQLLEHSVLEVGIGSTVSAMLQQCSSPIYLSALKKIHRFITSSVFEVKVSGKLAAHFCRAAVRIKPELSLKIFIPHLCSSIKTFMEDHPGVYEEEHLDNAFMWNLLILSQLMRCDGVQLLTYKSELLDVIQASVHLKCVQAYEMAGQLLRFLLRSLTQIYPLEFCSVEQDFDQPFENYLSIRDWATPGDVDDLHIQWHTPSQEEVAFAQEMLDCLLVPQLEFFQNISVDNEVSKEELLRQLNLVMEVISGAGSHLAPLDGEKVHLVDSQVPLIRFSCYVCLNGAELTAKGKNVRESVHGAISHLLRYLSASREDDTKSLFHIIKIYESILMHYGTVRQDFDSRWKSFHIVKSSLENQLTAKKKHLRALLIDRMQLQHELRTLNFCERHFTKRHQDITADLLSLSVSRYREVRKKAQTSLHQILRTYAFSYHVCLNPLAENLVNSSVEEHVFKGSLHTIQGGGKTCLANKRNWETLLKLWPSLVQAQHSEKPSILRVIEDIMNKVFKGLETFAIVIMTSADVIKSAGRLLSEGTAPLPEGSPATAEELQSGIEFERSKNEAATQNFNSLVDKIIDLVQSGKLTWKFNQIGYEFLSLLIHEDVPPSPQFISLFTKNCASDLLYVRKLSLNTLAMALEVMKRKPKKIVVDLEKAAGVGPIDHNSLVPGDREDNMWLQYDPAKFITSEEEWNKHIFIEKTHWGYYCWPKELKTYAPYSELPKLDRTREELSDSEKAVYDCWMNADFVAKVFEFLALEEDKSSDKFRLPVVKYFKCLFRNFGETFLEQCKPHIEKYAKDQSHNKHASSQRCAMEALAGLINGSKIWPYSKLERVWAWIIPILEHVLANLTVDTLGDWNSFFMHICENRAPHKLQWLYRTLLKNPLDGEGGAFGDTASFVAKQPGLGLDSTTAGTGSKEACHSGLSILALKLPTSNATKIWLSCRAAVSTQNDRGISVAQLRVN